jgi:hypothetical protein
MSVTGLDFGVTVPPEWGTREYEILYRRLISG